MISFHKRYHHHSFQLNFFHNLILKYLKLKLKLKEKEKEKEDLLSEI